MSISLLAYLLGGLAIAMALAGLLLPKALQSGLAQFPRNHLAGHLLAATASALAAREAFMMNMGGLSGMKSAIYLIAPLVYIGSVTCLKELLAARALGGVLCLIAVPVVKVAALSGAPAFQVITLTGYGWAIWGITLLLAPWKCRQLNEALLRSPKLLRVVLAAKLLFGLGLLYLGSFVYSA